MTDNGAWNLLKTKILMCRLRAASYNTAYTLRADVLALRDIAPFGRNVVYAGNVRRNAHYEVQKQETN